MRLAGFVNQPYAAGMVGFGSGSRRSMLLTALMAAIVVVLALLQYQWSIQVSEAERGRMQRALDNSVRQFREDFNRELRQVGRALQPSLFGFAEDDGLSYARRFEDWRQRSSYAGLVRSVFFLKFDAGRAANLIELNPDRGGFEPADWPDRLRNLQGLLRGPPERQDRPGRPAINPFTWTILYEGPVLAQVVLDNMGPGAPRGRRALNRRAQGYVVVELDRDFLRDALLPELAARHFGGPDGLVFQVWVMEDEQSLYHSHPESSSDISGADAREPLLWGQEELVSRLAGRRGGGGPGSRGAGGRQRPRGGASRGGPGGPAPGPDPVLRPRGVRDFVLSPPGAAAWELVVRHGEGSLEQVVAAYRNRNLAVSFGVLLLLCMSMGMILVSAQRAQRLAKAQMEFVAGVSHELRTPLAVICSAAENLADGVVGAKEQVTRYGTLIRDEGRRLTGMVEQTLQFAAGQSNRKAYQLKRHGVEEIVEKALHQSAPAIENAGYRLEKTVDADLPAVEVDAAALSQSLQNLIGNAVKYGGANRWVGVRAEAAEAPGSGREVRISVRDKGLGIRSQDLPHVFDPFFRGEQATARQIHGTGLGLSLARDAVVAMGGRISVKTSPGEGSTFTIHLPAASANGAPSTESA